MILGFFMELNTNFFPLGIAQGEAFCNRTHETEWLINNFKNGKHSLLISPRRYGKTSLAYKAINISGWHNAQIDFAMATSEQKIESYFTQGITSLISKILGPVDKTINLIKKYVGAAIPKIALKGGAVSLELEFPAGRDPAPNIVESLSLLENLLVANNTKAIILCDEFQMVGVIAKGKGVEAAIRSVLQKTQNLAMIFSGSNRRLLQNMFDDSTRPFYKLCKKLTLERINYEDYFTQINKAAFAKWNKPIPPDVFAAIANFSELHSYYLNKLCDHAWENNTNPPTVANINASWQALLEEERSDVLSELAELSVGQKKVLALIAAGTGMDSGLTSKETSFKLDMPTSSIKTALLRLEEEDVVATKNGQYMVINPVIKAFAKDHGLT